MAQPGAHARRPGATLQHLAIFRALSFGPVGQCLGTAIGVVIVADLRDVHLELVVSK